MNIKSEAKPSGTGQGANGGGQGASEPVKWGKITQAIATWIGELIDIRWDTGQGTAKLEDAKDENGRPIEKEVPCTFCFCGQHWPFNSQAYQAEDPKSHSAFAFFIHDRALLVQRKPYAGEVDEDGDGWIYEAVAVITEKKDENGEPITDPVTGIVQNEVARRWCWPLFRNEHTSFLVNAWYNYDPVSMSFIGEPFTNPLIRLWRGYPFINIDTRELVEPFVDQQGNERPLGTLNADGATGNMRLVITKEQQVEVLPDGTQQLLFDENEDPIWCYVPHAMHEFFDANGIIQYIPDITLRREPNWKGRIVGLGVLIGSGNTHELLIDNIPVARLIYDDSPIQASWNASVHWVFHINDETNILTVLRVTVDDYMSNRDFEGTGDFSLFYYPKYSFAVQSAVINLDQFNIYESELRLKPDAEEDDIHLLLNEELSWKFWDMVSALVGENGEVSALVWSMIDNLSNTYHTAKAGSSDGAIPSIDVELSFYKGVSRCIRCNHERRKVSFKVCTDSDGACSVQKEIVDEFEPISGIGPSDFNTAYDGENGTNLISIKGTIAQTIAVSRIDRVEEVVVQLPNGEEETQTLVVTETSEFFVEASGHQFSKKWPADGVPDSNIVLTYKHKDINGEFEICSSRQALQNNKCTLVLTVFTLVNVEAGVYAYWEWDVLNEVDNDELDGELEDVWVETADGGMERHSYRRWPALQHKVRWRHYVRDKNNLTMTHEFEFAIPYGKEENMSVVDVQSRKALMWPFSGFYVQKFEDGKKWSDMPWASWPGGRLFILPHFICDGGRVAAMVKQEKDTVYIGFGEEGDEDGPAPVNFVQFEGCAQWLAKTTGVYGWPGRYYTSTHGFQLDTTGRYGGYPDFSLHPFASKGDGIWPYYKTVDFGGNVIATLYWQNPTYLAGAVLFSESMEIHGFALEPGLWLYSFKIKGRDENPVVVKSEEMGKMLRCTGRDDTFFTLD